MLNFLGSNENLSVLAGSQWDSTFSFKDELTGDAANLDGVTFSGRVVANEYVYDITIVRVDGYEEGNVVQVVVPPLPEGRWRYEIYATTDSGYKTRMFYGFIAAIGLADFDPEIYANRTLSVMLPGDANKRIRADWMATTAAVLAAQQARDAVAGMQSISDDARQAVDAANEVLSQMDSIGERLEDAEEAQRAAEEAQRAAEAAQQAAEAAVEEAQHVVDDAPRAFIPTIVDGYWAINGEVTPHKAIGEDGLDGARVVRHLVNSAEEIPQEGETCNSGHVYYVPQGEESRSELWTVLGETESTNGRITELIFSPARTWVREKPEAKLRELALEPGNSNLNPNLLYAHVYAEEGNMWVYVGRSTNTARQEARQKTRWSFGGLSVAAGVRVKVVFTQTMEEPSGMPETLVVSCIWVSDDEGSKVVNDEGTYRMCADVWWTVSVLNVTHYDVYEWFEGKGWCYMPNKQEEIGPATSVHDGVVKLGSDAIVHNGTPVAVNSAGQLMVPRASFELEGIGKPSTSNVVGRSTDGAIGMDDNGRFWAEHAAKGRFGTIKPSRTDDKARVLALGIIPDGIVVDGLDRSGQLGMTRADVDTYGAVKCSAHYTDAGVFANLNKVIPVGIRQDTVLHGDEENTDPWYWGANGQMVVPIDAACAITWDPLGAVIGEQHGASWYTGGHLTLRTSAQFAQSNEVGLELLPATDSRLGGVTLQGTGHAVKTAELSDAEKTALERLIAEVMSIALGSIKANATLMSIQVLTQSAYDQLASLTSNTLYIVYPD